MNRLLIAIFLGFFILGISIYTFYYQIFFQEKEERCASSSHKMDWPMFKHDVYRSGNMIGKVFNVSIIIEQGGNQSKGEDGLSTVGSNAPEGEKRQIIEKNDTFDPSPIFVDLDLDGNDEVITYYKNTVYNITTHERPFLDFVMAVKYKKNPSLLEKLDFGGAPFVVKWRFILPKEIHTSFAAGDLNNDGYPEIAFGCDDGNLYVLGNEGKLLFKFKTNGKVRSTPAIFDIDNDERQEIIFGSDDGNLYVIDNKGNLKWKFKTQGKIQSSPTIYQDGTTTLIIFGSDDKNLYLLKEDGKLKCKFETNGKIRSSPLVYKGKIVFGSDDGNIYLLDTDCNLIKSYKTEGKVRSSPALFGDYFVVGSEDGNLYFFNKNEIKNLPFSTPIFSTPVSIKNKILVSTFDGRFYLADINTKKIIYKIDLTKNLSCSPSIGYIKGLKYSCFHVQYENNAEYAGFFIE